MKRIQSKMIKTIETLSFFFIYIFHLDSQFIKTCAIIYFNLFRLIFIKFIIKKKQYFFFLYLVTKYLNNYIYKIIWSTIYIIYGSYIFIYIYM